MRILFTNNPPVISLGLAAGLSQIGEEVEVLPLWMTSWEEQGQVIEKAIDDFKPDFLFTEGDPPNFNREVVLASATAHGIPVIYWAIQDPVWFREISLHCARRADYVFTTTVELLPAYRDEAGKEGKLLLFGCNPDFHRPVAPVARYHSDVAFVGNNYKRRAEVSRWMFQPAIELGLDLKVWGQGWGDPQQPYRLSQGYDQGMLPYDEPPRVYSSSKIILGMHLDASSYTQTSVRTYEVLGCRAFYLTQFTRAHGHLFTKGVHLEWAAGEGEVRELVRYYLNQDAARERIARAGQEHVYLNHTYAKRAAELKEGIRP